MKKFSFLFALLFLGLSLQVSAQADAISQYFSKYMDDENFTVIYVSGKLFSMFDNATEGLEDEEVKAIKSVVSDMRGLRILTTDKDPGAFYQEALSIVNKHEYEVLMEVREGKDQKVQFLVKESGDVVNELLLLVGEAPTADSEGEFVLMSFVGNINLKELSKLEEAFDNENDGRQ